MMRCFQFFILIVFAISYSVPPVLTLRLTRVSVPAYKKKGESAVLECKFELRRFSPSPTQLHGSLRLEQQHQQRGLGGGGSSRSGSQHDADETGDLSDFLDSRELLLAEAENTFSGTSEALYSVKWYKDDEEFYRFLPKSNPPQHSYRVEGIRVDHQHSNSTTVTLRSLVIRSSGVYRCEVSAEAPSFDSVQAEGRMTIVQLPKEGPRISGEGNQYQIGDLLALNCTSGRSHPASVLHWYINDKLVINPDTLIKYPHHQHPQGLITTTLGLEMDIEVHHFLDGEMRVKCAASVSPVWWQGDKENVFRRRMLEHQETMLLVRSGAVGRTTTGINALLVSLVSLVAVVHHIVMQWRRSATTTARTTFVS